MDPAGTGSQAGGSCCSECGTGGGRVSPGVVRGMVISGPCRVGTLLGLDVSECELSYEYVKEEVFLCQPGLCLQR